MYIIYCTISLYQWYYIHPIQANFDETYQNSRLPSPLSPLEYHRNCQKAPPQSHWSLRRIETCFDRDLLSKYVTYVTLVVGISCGLWRSLNKDSYQKKTFNFEFGMNCLLLISCVASVFSMHSKQNQKKKRWGSNLGIQPSNRFSFQLNRPILTFLQELLRICHKNGWITNNHLWKNQGAWFPSPQMPQGCQ